MSKSKVSIYVEIYGKRMNYKYKQFFVIMVDISNNWNRSRLMAKSASDDDDDGGGMQVSQLK